MWGEECAPVSSCKPWNRAILKTLSVTYNVGTNSVHSNFMRNKVGTWQKEALWLFGQACVTDVQAHCTRGKSAKKAEEAEENVGLLRDCCLSSAFRKQFLIDRQQWINSVKLSYWFPKKSIWCMHFFCSVTLEGIYKALKTSSWDNILISEVG